MEKRIKVATSETKKKETYSILSPIEVIAFHTHEHFYRKTDFSQGLNNNNDVTFDR